MRVLAPRAGIGERYATQMGELWSGLTRTLARLDELAADPKKLDEEQSLAALRRLQYALHAAGERVYGLAPPVGAEALHAELWAALAGARDATGEVVEAAEEEGAEAAGPLVHEWRGALFRVRLARLRLAGPRRPSPAAGGHGPRDLTAPLLAFLLVAGGASAFAIGAGLGRWPVWLAGMLALCASALAYRP
jgi:hypothetical protein